MEWKINIQEKMDVTTIRKKFQERLVSRISQDFNQWKLSVLSVCTRIWQVGADDPRKVIHSIKVGLALSLVSLFYFVRPMFHTFGGNAIWAVVAVVLAFEFTVGATLSKGLNISCATFLAGFLGVGVSYVAQLTGKNCELVILGVSIFVIGDDLHNSILCHMEVLAESLEECVTKYFGEPKDGHETGYDEVPRACKFVLNSKATEETLLSFASWEPPHRRFFFRYPWNLYEKVGNMTRHCAYSVEALNGFLKSEIQDHFAVRENVKTASIDIGIESANILRRLAERVRTTRRSKSLHLMMDRLRTVVRNLQISLSAQSELYEKPLRVPENFLEGLSTTENLQASSIPKPAKEADQINRVSTGITMEEEEMQADTSRDRARKICEMREMKQSSWPFMEILPLVSFSALLIETVAKLESVIIAVEELEEAIFRNTDQ